MSHGSAGASLMTCHPTTLISSFPAPGQSFHHRAIVQTDNTIKQSVSKSAINVYKASQRKSLSSATASKKRSSSSRARTRNMDLSSLYTNLPPGQLAQAERQMMENFRGRSRQRCQSTCRLLMRLGGSVTAAALSITTLYKSSLNTSKVSIRFDRFIAPTLDG
jgi:hypothetical protein